MTSRTRAAIGSALLAPAIPCALLFYIFYQPHLGRSDLYFSATFAFVMTYVVTMITGIPWHLSSPNRRLLGYILMFLAGFACVSFASDIFTRAIFGWPLDPFERTDTSTAFYGAVVLTVLYSPVTVLNAWLFRSLALWLEGKEKPRGLVPSVE